MLAGNRRHYPQDSRGADMAPLGAGICGDSLADRLKVWRVRRWATILLTQFQR